MEQILVSDIMSDPGTMQPGISVTPDTTVVEAARLMRQHKIHRLPVVSADGQLLGIVTESDVARAIHEMTFQAGPRELMYGQIPPGLLVK